MDGSKPIATRTRRQVDLYCIAEVERRKKKELMEAISGGRKGGLVNEMSSSRSYDIKGEEEDGTNASRGGKGGLVNRKNSSGSYNREGEEEDGTMILNDYNINVGDDLVNRKNCSRSYNREGEEEGNEDDGTSYSSGNDDDGYTDPKNANGGDGNIDENYGYNDEDNADTCDVSSGDNYDDGDHDDGNEIGRKRVLWSDAEEDYLKKAVKEIGTKNKNMSWVKILKAGNRIFHPCRSANNLKDKWRRMMG